MTTDTDPVRVLIVDDSATARALLWSVLRRDPSIEVVGEASEPLKARQLIKALSPDVITLDVEMPRMNGLTFLEKLMALRPMPVVVISSRVKPDSDVTIRALALGAVDCIDASVMHENAAGDMICRSVKEAARAKLTRSEPARASWRVAASYEPSDKIVLVGASTGGVDAIFAVMDSMPPNAPAMVVAQHMPERFLAGFAAGLDARFSPSVRLADAASRLDPGRVHVCPGGTVHTILGVTSGAPRLLAESVEGGCAHIPSIDRLFRSALPIAERIVAVLLTGMGRDGAEGMLALRQAGATTITQTAASSVVDGMPGAARELQAQTETLPLGEIGPRILDITRA